MNQISKVIILIAILVIPVVIFLFLKAFGNNEFSIPVYYESGTGNLFADCPSGSGDQQFYATNMVSDKIPGSDIHIAIFFRENQSLTVNKLSNKWTRLKETFRELPVKSITYSISSNDSLPDELGETVWLDDNDFSHKMHCDAATDTVNQFILIDKLARIRGYYNLDLEEIDRLIVETKILLEE